MPTLPVADLDRRTESLLRKSPAAARRRILFAKLGSFSHTNERLLEQLGKQFPQYEVETFDVKEHVKREIGAAAWNALIEVATFGPSVLANASDRHAYFFFTPYMFRHISAAIRNRFSARADRFDFVIQTQGLFNAALPGRPFVVYTDHTVASYLEYPIRDERLLRSRGFRMLERELFHRADRIVTTAGHVERTLIAQYGVDPAHVATIGIGANVAAVDTDDALDRYRNGHIVYVGIDWERKGGPVLLEAFERIADRFPEARLTIIGCSPATRHPRVQALGLLPRPAVAQHLANAAIFCLPSLVEPSAVASVEAMAFRLPVVATNVGGFPEMVVNGETGTLVPPGDATALAEALADLLENPAKAQAMGRAGYERSQTSFTWDAIGERLRQQIGLVLAPDRGETRNAERSRSGA